MADNTMALTRQRLLFAVIVVGLASAGAGAGTVAMFSDTEAQSATVSAGTIDLRVNGADQTVQFLTESDITAGASGTATVNLNNTGSNAGRVVVTVSNLTNDDNGFTNGEKSVDTDDGPGNGELQNHLVVNASSQDGSATWSDDTKLTNLSSNIDNDPGYMLASGENGTFVLGWRLPSNTGKIVNSDSIELQLSFRLEQTTEG